MKDVKMIMECREVNEENAEKLFNEFNGERVKLLKESVDTQETTEKLADLREQFFGDRDYLTESELTIYNALFN